MINHVAIAVTNLAASATFYDRVLEPLGLERIAEQENRIGYGKKYPEFWLSVRPTMTPIGDDTGNHVCLRAPSKEAVTRFYDEALTLGGRGDGEPGDRHATVTKCFSAFIRDPDGNKIEAITFPCGSRILESADSVEETVPHGHHSAP